ncbi:MAG: DUF5683 domain-containing protein [Bacteroidaceae bacterium]
MGRITICILLLLLGKYVSTNDANLWAQKKGTTDSLFFTSDKEFVQTDSLLKAQISAQKTDTATIPNLRADSIKLLTTPAPKLRFIPSPQRALWLALVLPGAGQIYNRKYWKLPIIYGGLLGCTYAFTWNQQMYRDYSQAYIDIMDDDPKTDSYKDLLPLGYDITGKEDRFKTIFKNKKDYYRRYRDLSIFCFVGVYILSVVDAYVDAELSVFDITKDLSLRIEPAIIKNNSVKQSNSFGLQCCLNF